MGDRGPRVATYRYIRTSTGPQEYSLDAQRTAVEREARHRGWDDLRFVEDAGTSGGTLDGRPGLRRLLDTLGPGDLLVVSRLDRLSRSVVDLGVLLARARRDSWHLIALDLGIDSSSAGGEQVANVLMAVAQWERRTIADRTREGLAAAKARGVKLGRPSPLSAATRDLIVSYRASGMTQTALADRLNSEGVPTSSGRGTWRHQLVARVLKRAALSTA